MNWLKQILVFRSYVKLQKFINNPENLDKVKEDRSWQAVLEYLKLDQKRTKEGQVFQCLRNKMAQTYNMLRKIKPFPVNEYLIEAKVLYNQLREQGNLIDKEWEEIQGKWVTKFTEQSASKSKNSYSDYNAYFGFEGWEKDFVPVTFKAESLHSGNNSDPFIGDKEERGYFHYSQCRFATEEEIAEAIEELKAIYKIKKSLKYHQSKVNALNSAIWGINKKWRD